ncbi:MAG: FecR domain-containing protein [Verrucomicrobia bacterium]|nr:FecR domain-containing protein [Verrucomicrobiota bacterium]
MKSVSGTVEYALPGETGFKPLKADQTLPMGTTVQTGKSGRAVIVTLPGAAIRMEGSSKVVLSELDFEKSGEKVTSRKAMIDLQSGTVSALISKNDPQTTDFRIKTPQGVAAARGTFYAVTVEGDKAHVAVKEGKVGIQKVEAAQAKAD